jgi:uncharacterized membrane protein
MEPVDWKELGKKVVQMGAPLLGGVLGGRAGSAAGTLIASLFGGDPEKPEELLQRIQMDPQAAIKLKELEVQQTIRLRELVLQSRQAELYDVASARAREVAIVQATRKKDWNLYVLAWVIIGGFIGLILTLIILQVVMGRTLQNDPLLALLLGSLGTDAGMVVGYFFGSSKSSSEKTALLAEKREP